MTGTPLLMDAIYTGMKEGGGGDHADLRRYSAGKTEFGNTEGKDGILGAGHVKKQTKRNTGEHFVSGHQNK